MAKRFDHDWMIVGSGFGGSVAALRLAEKGYEVTVLEQGRRFRDEDFARSAWQARRMVWMPRFGMRGIQAITPLRHVTVVSGVGVGGGSLVYGNTLYVPHSDDFYRHPNWAELADWREVLRPHYETAKRMLGVTQYEGDSSSERLMRALATDLGVADSYHGTDVGVFFGEPGQTVPDPYFDGQGPERTGCIRCGQCMLGCRHNAKNTLVKNYLYLAQRLGVSVEAERQVIDIRPLNGTDGASGYAVTSERSGAWVRRARRTETTQALVIAAGPLGTNKLLRRCKDRGSLPNLSERLGDEVRTNSEAITAVTAPRGTDLRTGVAITSSVHPDDHTHFTNNSYGVGGNAMALTFGPLTGGKRRIRQFAAACVRNPGRWLTPIRLRDWSRRSIVFTFMQSLDSSLQLKPRGRSGRLDTVISDGKAPASQLPIANHVTELAAEHTGGYPQTSVFESLRDAPTTAHILGGAIIAADASRGVVDRRRRVFGYENMLITDGATLPANVGVNPSLTITAMAEEALSHVEPKQRTRPARLPVPAADLQPSALTETHMPPSPLGG
jgi:cholesterol oxidase